MKICCHCKRELDESCFYKNKSSKDGLHPECKDCVFNRTHTEEFKKKQIIYRSSEKFLKKNRNRCKKYYNKPEKRKRILSRNKKWYESHERNYKKINEYGHKYRMNNKDKIKCRSLLNYAIKKNKIIRPKKCSNCGKSGRIIAHHDDYSKPFDVIWLCSKCHVNLHKNRLLKMVDY